MKNTILLLAIMVIFSSCNQENEDAQHINLSSKNDMNKSQIIQKINFNEETPIIIENSDWILIPLNLQDLTEIKENDRKVSLRSSNFINGYWNVSFYNYSTGEINLLDDNGKMVISRINTDKIKINKISTRIDNNNLNKIYYEVIKQDYNKNNILDNFDPKYLFNSDVNGSNFKQISPKNYNVIEWIYISNSNKIILITNSDTDKNSKFNINDETTLFIYDLKIEKLDVIIKKEVLTKYKELFYNEWIK